MNDRGSYCVDESCPAHGELVRLRKENEALRRDLSGLRNDLAFVIRCLWSSWMEERVSFEERPNHYGALANLRDDDDIDSSGFFR